LLAQTKFCIALSPQNNSLSQRNFPNKSKEHDKIQTLSISVRGVSSLFLSLFFVPPAARALGDCVVDLGVREREGANTSNSVEAAPLAKSPLPTSCAPQTPSLLTYFHSSPK
jgi:hypothetical protein